MACRYVVGLIPAVPLADATADLVYTGKGALIWMPDLARWADEVARLLRPGGVCAAAWGGQLPNSFALLARR